LAVDRIAKSPHLFNWSMSSAIDLYRAQVRVNMLVQQQTLEPRRPAAHKPRRVHAQLASTPATPASSASHRKGHRDMAAVVERAQLRLAAARGEAPDSPTAIKEAATLR
jgi:hypothetical protein